MILVSFKDSVFICGCAFEERNVPKRAGFRWDNERKRWTTSSIEVAARLRQHMDESAKKQTARLLITNTPWTGPVSIPGGKEIHDFQHDATLFALSRSASYLALDPGLGKTIIAALIARTLAHAARSAVSFTYICPPFLTRNVEEEFKTWEAPPTVIIPDSMIHKPGILNVVKGIASAPDVKVLFIDEAHRFKNLSAKRTKVLFEGIVPLFDRVVFLSGTPMPNRPMELFPVLHHCAPETIDFMNMFEYGRRYCGGVRTQFGWTFTGATNMDTLSARVKGVFMLRLRKHDVLKELPPKIEEMVILESDMPAKLARLDAALLRAISPEDLMKGMMTDLHSEDGETLHISTYRKELGIYKVAKAIEYIHSILAETDEALLVFAIHAQVIEELKWGLDEYEPFTITGQTPMSERHIQVKEFQESATRRLFIGNIQAMGTGFTLTKATRVVFVEFSWTPGDNSQASDRAHRIGQRDSVYCQYLVFRDSIDKTVLETNLRKNKITEKL